jgi:ABC-type multidrug transport system permease subunit
MQPWQRHAGFAEASEGLLRDTGTVGIKFVRLLWKELFEFRSRPILLGTIVALSIGAAVAAGNLNIEPATVQIQLYSPISDTSVSPNPDAAEAIIQEFSNVHVIRMKESSLNLEAMQRDGAQFAIVPRGGKWVVFYNFPTFQQEREAAWFVNVLSTSLSEEKPLIADSSQSSIKKLGLSSRISALPGDSEILLVPRTISLVVLFLPFVLSARSFSRELSFGTLPTMLASPSGGWLPLLAAKSAASSWVSVAILLILILAIRPIFGIAPKPGIVVQLGAQSLAIMASATLGLFAMVWSRNSSQIYISVSLYFLILVLLSGFLFPLETASPIIRLASNVSPLTYSVKIFESWLFYGTDARVFGLNIMALIAQLIAAVLALVVVSWSARRQI